MADSLEAAERETVIRYDDSSEVATITTHSRPTLTKLRKNPAARETEDLTIGSSVGARFEIPKALVSLRSKTRKGGPGNPEALRKARERRSVGAQNDAPI